MPDEVSAPAVLQKAAAGAADHVFCGQLVPELEPGPQESGREVEHVVDASALRERRKHVEGRRP
eukprot:2393966-Rhodomonas_salina.1